MESMGWGISRRCHGRRSAAVYGARPSPTSHKHGIQGRGNKTVCHDSSEGFFRFISFQIRAHAYWHISELYTTRCEHFRLYSCL